MESKYYRLDRFISKHTVYSKKSVRLLIAQQRISIDDLLATSIQQQIGPFNKIVFDEQIIQDQKAVYLMLNKPKGVVSATKDEIHSSVLDLIPAELHLNLHIVGRLDLNSTGLVLLSNDGKWSSAITRPDKKVKKHYRVEVQNTITKDCIQAFEEGIYFPYEGITTQPAKLTCLDDKLAKIELEEGKYHQIKRMFGRFKNPVLSIHREMIGSLALPSNLPSGKFRHLTSDEIKNLTQL